MVKIKKIKSYPLFSEKWLPAKTDKQKKNKHPSTYNLNNMGTLVHLGQGQTHTLHNVHSLPQERLAINQNTMLVNQMFAKILSLP